MYRPFAFLPFFLVVLALFSGPTQAVAATNLDTQNYRRGFAALDAGHPENAVAYARGNDPVLNEVLKGYYMAQPGNDISFEEMATFISQNPDWPNIKGILAMAEQKIPTSATPQQVANWFTAHPPLTVAGFIRAMDALDATGQTQDSARLVRARWIDGDFTNDEFTAFHNRFARYLDVDANWARLDRLLWKNDSVNARHMYPYVDEDMKAVADARLALANQNPNADAFIERVPGSEQNDPGLLFERLRWRVHNNLDDQALDILQHAPDNLGKPEAWWDQRQIEIRRAMERHDYELAYRLASEHGQKDGKSVLEGEFLAGWLALRFLNQPERARDHFQVLYDNASTPISRARGAYWLGRTYEVLNNKNDAEQAYETAAALDITYYGQLATTRLYVEPVIRAMPEPTIPPAVRKIFFDRDLIRAVEHLHALGENERVDVFFRAAVDTAFQRSDFALLTELAYQINRPDLAIVAAKAANQKNMLMAAGGFPVLDIKLPRPPEPAFTHALIRQESMFNPSAKSPAGAHGLMQLMPRTAKDVARKLGIKFKPARLENSDYNLRLGTTFVQNQLAIFSGSYVLALAGYNAGPGRVHEWMREIGDPRDPNVDPVDWIEMIPIAETRNYVQRIIESLQVYRARLNGGQAPLLILKDLKR